MLTHASVMPSIVPSRISSSMPSCMVARSSTSRSELVFHTSWLTRILVCGLPPPGFHVEMNRTDGTGHSVNCQAIKHSNLIPDRHGPHAKRQVGLNCARDSGKVSCAEMHPLPSC